MTMTNVDVNELKEIIEATPDEQNIMITGKHGIGKSQIVTQYFTEKGIKVQTLFLGQMSDPGDLIGLPSIENGQTVFNLPFWFPKNNEPIVLFLDELNRARPEVLQTIMDLTLNKTIAGRKLPEGSRIFSAVNEGEEYQLTELDPALVDRFHVYNLVPSPAEWIMYATRAGLDSRVIDFISANADMLDATTKKNSDLDKSPSRRSWEQVAKAIAKCPGDLTPIYKKLISGIIGPETTLVFMKYLAENSSLKGEDIINNYQNVKSKLNRMQIHERSLLNESIFRSLSVSSYDHETATKNVLDYIKDLFASDNKELKADFASNMEKIKLYKTGIKFIYGIPEVKSIIKDFIINL